MARPSAYELKGTFFGDFRGRKVYYTGFDKQPKFLKKGGAGFGGLKHLLELLKKKFGNFTLTFTPEEDSIRRDSDVVRVRISQQSIKKLNPRIFAIRRAALLKLASGFLASTFPDEFISEGDGFAYERGLFASILTDSFDPRLLSPEDREAITKYVTSEAARGVSALDIPTAYQITRDAQLIYLEQLLKQPQLGPAGSPVAATILGRVAWC